VAVALGAFDELLDQEGVESGRMLHNVGLRAGNGKYFGFERRGELVVKLPADRVASLIASGEGSVMDRGQPDRPLKEWVCLRPADEAAAAAYLREARSFVDPALGYVRQLSLAASVPACLDAIASPERWWSPDVSRSGATIRVSFDGVGEVIELRYEGMAALDGGGETDELRDEGGRASAAVVWTCVSHWGAADWRGSVLLFSLREAGPSSSSLLFEHRGVPRALVAAGWERFLGSLAAYVATGEGEPFRTAS
jgi:hypothetical protein